MFLNDHRLEYSIIYKNMELLEEAHKYQVEIILNENERREAEKTAHTFIKEVDNLYNDMEKKKRVDHRKVVNILAKLTEIGVYIMLLLTGLIFFPAGRGLALKVASAFSKLVTIIGNTIPKLNRKTAEEFVTKLREAKEKITGLIDRARKDQRLVNLFENIIKQIEFLEKQVTGQIQK